MSVLSMSSARPMPETDLEQITQLAVTLSGQLARVNVDDIAQAIAAALERVACATHADACHLIEISEMGTVARVHVPTRATNEDDQRQALRSPDEWLAARLARGEAVTISRPDEIPAQATLLRAHARQPATCAVLGVPASVAGRIVCALILENTRFPRRWPEPLVERLKLVSEILGAALER